MIMKWVTHGSIRIVSLTTILSSVSVGRSMRCRYIRRLFGSIKVWRRGSFESVFVSSHFEIHVLLQIFKPNLRFISIATQVLVTPIISLNRSSSPPVF
ncbi:uncharacterized protein BJ212DRAFT_1369958 [Suillus subaureus]|uniref:Uncharacterized protein n=1 Tax=Suillus subaureus TaxID=48587 RepID=A0A9P7JBA0_9AGAM|nr:uncharacterized protein BJ212DRAFT_1369958 [Suillus subaureus]KAG1812483.1 hypothetical protein BJ212DRAFT_1369958 [Suillus subaureus]